MIQCKECQEIYANDEECPHCKRNKPVDAAVDSIERNRSLFPAMYKINIEIWNAAIEAAALISDEADEIAARDIRKLKK